MRDVRSLTIRWKISEMVYLCLFLPTIPVAWVSISGSVLFSFTCFILTVVITDDQGQNLKMSIGKYLLNLLVFYVTCNDISVIYVTAQMSVGLPTPYTFRRVLLRARPTLTRDQPLYTVIPTHHPIKSPFTTRWGYGGRILDLNPRRPHGGNRERQLHVGTNRNRVLTMTV